MKKSNLSIATKGLLTAACFGLLFACGGGNESVENGDESMIEEEMVDELETEDIDKKAVYYATPSLLEVASVIKSTGASFSSDVLNSSENKNKYTTQYKRALNMGVYGSDLAYSALFEETQSAINYLRTVKELSDEMGMDGVFEVSLLQQIESNISNTDSLINVISEFYWSADSYLEDNQRGEVASLIVAGGWVEAIYIATQMAKNSPDNQEIRDRIAEQKLILKNLLLLMNGKKNANNSESDELIAQLESLKATFDKIGFESTTGEVTSDEASQSTEIGNSSQITMNEDLLTEITSQITTIRNQLIN